jgi:hypothetical protein
MKAYRRVALVGITALSCKGEEITRHKSMAIGDSVSCASCTIELKTITSIGGTADSLRPDAEFVRGLRDGQGRYWIGPMQDRTIQIYDHEGRYLRSLARLGRGPGELGFPSNLALGRGDTVAVLDNQNGIILFTPALAFGKTVVNRSPMRHPSGFVQTPDGQMLLSGGGRPDLQPLVIVDSTGDAVNQFGLDSGKVRSPSLFQVRIFPGSHGTVWLPYNLLYRFDGWSSKGDRMYTIRRDAQWFPSFTDAELQKQMESGATNGPLPELMGGFQDSSGLLWSVVRVADARWKEVWDENVARHQDAGMIQDEDRIRYFDTVIEVMDPAKGELVATHRVDAVLRPIAGGPFLFSIRYDAGSRPSIDVWEFQLKGR